MKRRTILISAVTTAAGGSALLGSGAFSESDSRRDVNIETVGDDEAYLQLRYGGAGVICSGTATLVELTNHLKEDIEEIQVSYTQQTGTDITLTDLDVPDELAVGESADVTVDVTCEASDPDETIVEFDVDVFGNETELSAQERETVLECTCADGENREGTTEEGNPGEGRGNNTTQSSNNQSTGNQSLTDQIAGNQTTES